jgi:hypothetical protein
MSARLDGRKRAIKLRKRNLTHDKRNSLPRRVATTLTRYENDAYTHEKPWFVAGAGDNLNWTASF